MLAHGVQISPKASMGYYKLLREGRMGLLSGSVITYLIDQSCATLCMVIGVVDTLYDPIFRKNSPKNPCLGPLHCLKSSLVVPNAPPTKLNTTLARMCKKVPYALFISWQKL